MSSSEVRDLKEKVKKARKITDAHRHASMHMLFFLSDLLGSTNPAVNSDDLKRRILHWIIELGRQSYDDYLYDETSGVTYPEFYLAGGRNGLWIDSRDKSEKPFGFNELETLLGLPPKAPQCKERLLKLLTDANVIGSHESYDSMLQDLRSGHLMWDRSQLTSEEMRQVLMDLIHQSLQDNSEPKDTTKRPRSSTYWSNDHKDNSDLDNMEHSKRAKIDSVPATCSNCQQEADLLMHDPDTRTYHCSLH